MVRGVGAVWRWYVGQLNRRPMLTQVWSTGVISGLGDILAQQTVEQKTLSHHDWLRTFQFSMVGLVFVGPVIRTWYVSLERIVGPSQTSTVALKKMVLDQFMFTPIFFSCLLPILWLTQGVQPAMIPEKLKQDYFTVLFNNYKIWPAAQLINFYLIPLKFRVNFSNLIAVGWNAYLSWQAHRNTNTTHD